MPGHLLRRCYQIAVAIFIDECKPFDLTPPQYVALAALAQHGPLDTATVGRVAALDRTTTALVLKTLRGRGLIDTGPSASDRRARANQITAKGLKVLAAVRASVAQVQEKIMAPLTPRERSEFLRLLGKVAQANNLLSRAPHRAHRAAS